MRDKEKDSLARKMFTVPTLDRLISGDVGDREAGLLSDCAEAFGARGGTNGELIRAMYSYMAEEYRCEYYFKNELAKWILSGGCPGPRAYVSAEQPIGDSRVDMVSVNQKCLTAYEIKTSLDTFARLEGQLADYYRVFPYAYVVVEENMAEAALDRIGNGPAGALCLSRGGDVRVIKKASFHAAGLDHAAMFSRIRKPECMEIVARRFGAAPDVNDFELYGACLGLFSTLPAKRAHGELARCYWKRAKKQGENWEGDAPDELTLYESLTKKAKREELTKFWEAGTEEWAEEHGEQERGFAW